MIALLQKSFKTKAFKIFMWAILLTLSGALSMIEIGRHFFGSSGPWVARVNGMNILHSDFTRQAQTHKERIDSMRSQYPEYADMIMQQLGSRAHPAHAALDTLVRQELMNDVARNVKLSAPTEEEIQNKLSDIRFVQQELADLVPMFAYNPATGSFNMQLVRNYLHRMGLSVEEFQQKVADAIKRERVAQILDLGSYVPEFELKNRFEGEHLGKRFTVLSMNTDFFIKEAQKKPVTDAQLKGFFEAHKENYRVPEKRTALTYSFTAPNYGVEISDRDIQTYYEKNKANYVAQPARVQVRRILFKIDNASEKSAIWEKALEVQRELVANPHSFAHVAQTVSQDADSAKKGGLLDPFAKGTHDATFERTAFTLKEDGAISPVIETKDGFEIVQRVAKTAQQFKPLAEVKKQIKDLLANKRFGKQFAQEVRTLLDGNALSKEAIKSFAQMHGATEKTYADLVNNGFPLSNLIYKMSVGDTNFYNQDTHGTIATLVSVASTFIPEFNAVKDAVKEDWYYDQARMLLTQALAKAKEKAEAGKSLDEFKQYGSLEQTGLMKKSDRLEIKRLERLGFPMAAFEIDKVGTVIGHEQEGNSSTQLPLTGKTPTKHTAVVVRLEEVEPFDKELFQEKKASLLKEQGQQQEPLAGSGFIASLYRNATINTNNELLQYQ